MLLNRPIEETAPWHALFKTGISFVRATRGIFLSGGNFSRIRSQE